MALNGVARKNENYKICIRGVPDQKADGFTDERDTIAITCQINMPEDWTYHATVWPRQRGSLLPG